MEAHTRDKRDSFLQNLGSDSKSWPSGRIGDALRPMNWVRKEAKELARDIGVTAKGNQ